MEDGTVRLVTCGRCGTTLSTGVREAGDLVVDPSSTVSLRSCGTDAGCCGSDGLDGPNRACATCGRVVGTARTDCWTTPEVRFLPDAVAVVVAGGHRA